jgi:hypothetical protein
VVAEGELEVVGFDFDAVGVRGVSFGFVAEFDYETVFVAGG